MTDQLQHTLASTPQPSDQQLAGATTAPAAALPSSGQQQAGAPQAHIPMPSTDDLKQELSRERTRFLFFRTLRSTIFSLIVVAAAASLVAILVLPILQISGNSMTDTLHDQDIVVAVRGSDTRTGDVIAFYYNNKILVKRVIANAGQWVNIDDAGNVFVDGTMLDEPYISEKALGDCNIKMPYQVPENRVFVMGDHRSVSIDSRNSTVGCVAEEQIVGKLLLCAWPFERLGPVR